MKNTSRRGKRRLKVIREIDREIRTKGYAATLRRIFSAIGIIK